MSGNKFGSLFQLTTFGESHGDAIGGIIDGCPSGIELDMKAIQLDLDRRNQVNQRLLLNVKNRMKLNFVRYFSR